MPTTIADINAVQPVEWRNERVLTTAQLAEFYGTTANSLRVNFFNAQKRDRFIEGKHFFLLQGGALKNLRVTNCYLQIPSMARGVYLWTKRGAARHAKMINTDKAWEVFELLEDAYFAIDANKLPGASFWWETEQKKDQRLTSREKINLLFQCVDKAATPELRDEIIRQAVKLVLS